LSCGILVSFTLLTLASLTTLFPGLLSRAFGIIAVVMATALLGPRNGGVIVILTWSVLTFIARGGVSLYALGHLEDYGILLLYLTTLALSAIAQGMLDTAVRWSLEGWTRARESLRDVRNRRQELYRALRALEEATYRIEHMNDELIIARRNAELAQAQKARFAATVSHELRGPLGVILGFGRMMALHPERYGHDLTPSFMMDVDSIYRNTQHLAALIDDVLDLSQIDADAIPLVKDRIDLKLDVVDKAVEIIQPLARSKGLALYVSAQENLPWLLADQVRIRQVLLNLLNNAVRHTEAGSITVRAVADQDAVVVTVADTGEGIPPDRQAELFLPFRQLRPEQQSGSKSSGLGLSICKQLVELHGGRIWLESQPGEGAAFSFSVPLPGVSSPRLVSKPESLENAVQERQRICLIAHHDQATIRLLARYIQGYRVVGVLDSDDLMTVIDRLRPRAIVVSLEQEVYVRRQLEASPYDIPLVACGFPMCGPPVEGIHSYFVKPVSSDTVGAIMQTVDKGEGAHVLVVDDNPDEVRLIERYLTDLPRPYTIAKAYSGKQALESMARKKPDVVFMDLVMPEMDGLATIRAMQQDTNLQGVRVVLISAKDWIEEQADVRTPVRISQERPLTMTQAACMFTALLDTLQPTYLTDQPPIGAPEPHQLP